ncbi:hypothetical protein RUM44_000638 [Polyplax serrata]|uniref:Fibronectin type-III domain-containing protein n=1 Tax=Polyplax serrata TaxID=468196 RepID=A0ABR1B6Z2_POLSC
MNDLELKAIAMQDKPRSLAPNHLGRSTSALYSMLLSSGFPKHFGRVTTLDVDANFSYVAPIRTMRKVGDDGIFLEWDVAHRPDNVVGYEILVNGVTSHRVRSSTRNKALLHSLNLNEKILIQLYATSENGRSLRCSHLTYPDGHAVYRSESQ